MTSTVISYPIPVYSNVPIQPQFYQPRQFFITDIVLGLTTLVQTAVDMDYVIGQEIRLLIPPNFGCYQLNNVTGYVIGIPAANQVLTDINSIVNVDAFILASTATQPQIVAVGDINSGIISSTGRQIPTTNIPGSFINISPQ